MSGDGSPSRGSPSRRRPLHERSKSHSNSLAIRVVPYSPPRPSDKHRDSTASASSARTPTSTTALLSPNPSELGHAGSSRTESRTDDRSASRASDRYSSHRRSYSSSTLTSILSPASSTFPLVSAKDRGVSGSKLRSDSWTEVPSSSSSTTPVPTTPTHQTDISRVNARSRSSQRSDDEATTPSAKRPLSRRRNLITINSDGKTFSLQPLKGVNQDQSSSRASRAPSLSLSTTASQERFSSDAYSENRPSSTVTSIPDRSFASTITPASSTTQLAGDHIANTGAASSSSPWNYRMVGGLRKVPNTPDPKQKQKASHLYPEPDQAPSHTSSPSDSRLAPLPEATAADASVFSDPHDLQTKTSFQSSVTASTSSDKTNYKIYSNSSPPRPDTDSVLPPPSTTSSEKTNYKVYGSSSPPPIPERDSSLPPPASSHSNYDILGRSSPPELSSAECSPPKTADSDRNYVVHAGSSPAPSSIATARRQRVRPEFSQESLLVAPLKPKKNKKKSRERFGYYKSRSRDSLRRAASIKSISSSVSFETAQNIIANPAAFYRSRIQAGSSRQPEKRAEPVVPAPAQVHMNNHPHQWSSQLSTVMSESEGGSDPPSRSVSPWSVPGRRGSVPLSSHSRQMLSISSSLAANEERSQERSLSHSQSFTDSLERPQATHSRGTLRLVSDQDEHGDGLTELHQLNNRPSRTRLASFFSNSSSDRNLHSSSSSRANSLNSASIPTWAKFYYGSGERRFLASSGESMMSADPNDSRPPSSFQSQSPSAEHLPLSIYSPRRRPREVNPLGPGPASDTGSMDIHQAPPHDHYMRSGLRKKTSSIWSPHLRRDQRAGRYSIWEPPSMTWSAENSLLGKRNMQVALFALGFILPFTWMIAAFLPLPPDPHAEMEERDHRSSLLDQEGDISRRVAAVDETLFQSARWWRALNRYMSVIGLLVVGAIAALVVVGVKQGWGQIA